MEELIEVNVAEATGAALDWMVAKVEEMDVRPITKDWGHPAGVLHCVGYNGYRFQPSTDWGQAGPLIEKHRIDISAPPLIDTNNEIGWQARPDDGMSFWKQGSTPLIAACRSIVTAKLGDKVMVPVELINEPDPN